MLLLTHQKLRNKYGAGNSGSQDRLRVNKEKAVVIKTSNVILYGTMNPPSELDHFELFFREQCKKNRTNWSHRDCTDLVV
jgi:hypothetical protein